MQETASFWPFTVKRPKHEELKTEQAEDLIKENLIKEILKALSRYTEMVNDIIRTQAEKLQQGSELTRVRLKEMDLPDSILSLEKLYASNRS
jgi:regulator of protease activity HflC (stomatin/prohibitin superfamily)